MRRLGGLALIALGVLSVLVGVAMAALFGPDDRMATGPHRLDTPGQAIVTAPEALAYSGPQVELTVTTPDERSLFVGVGHDVDVRDFLADTPRTRIDSIEIPWKVSTTHVPGQGAPKGDPQERGWWLADTQGHGEATLSWRLPDTAADVVVLGRGRGEGLTVDVTAALVIPSAFVAGLAMMVLGLGVVIFGWALRGTRAAAPRGLHALRARRGSP